MSLGICSQASVDASAMAITITTTVSGRRKAAWGRFTTQLRGPQRPNAELMKPLSDLIDRADYLPKWDKCKAFLFSELTSGSKMALKLSNMMIQDNVGLVRSDEPNMGIGTVTCSQTGCKARLIKSLLSAMCPLFPCIYRTWQAHTARANCVTAVSDSAAVRITAHTP